MRLSLVTSLLLAIVFLCCSCAPTMRMILTDRTAVYTQCNYVEVECVDEDCSNVAGGPWMATACGTRYRCTETDGNVVCAPMPK
jgi:hypothetical protein